ncbi:MAG: PorT family protein [Bacteroidales bacterium]|jgi:hypothetical protein|nr:PorT family protein [Bacteroidales bacterium]
MRQSKTVYSISLTIFMLFTFQTSFCQEKYLPGYIVSLQDDTIVGSIDYRNWENNPDRIFFKGKSDDKKLGYTPLEIKGFGVLDEIYESAIIETEISSVNTEDLSKNYELIIQKDTTFLQAMVKGIKSLYYYKSKFGKEQFYIKQDSLFELLVYKKYLKDQEGQTNIVENKKFIGQLILYLQDCSTIQQKLQNTEYQKNSLEKLFLSYYDCTQSGMLFHKKTEKVSVAFGVLAGVSVTSLRFWSEEFAYLVNADYNLSVNFSAGLFMDVILSRNHEKWSINNELVLSSYKVNGRFDEYTNENKYTITYTTIGFSYLKMNNMIRFKYPVGKIFLYLNAGISNGYAIIVKNYKKTESKLFDQERIEEGKALNDTRRYELGYVIGLGSKFKKFGFEIRYENGTGISPYLYLSSATNRFYCFLSYIF